MTNDSAEQYDCKKFILAIHDAMDMLGGKWKVYIIASIYLERKRYSQILKDLQGISGKTLSRELKDMEMNQLIKRTVLNTQPVSVFYELTEYGESLKSVILKLASWGSEYRKKIVI